MRERVFGLDPLQPAGGAEPMAKRNYQKESARRVEVFKQTPKLPALFQLRPYQQAWADDPARAKLRGEVRAYRLLLRHRRRGDPRLPGEGDDLDGVQRLEGAVDRVRRYVRQEHRG
jgi:hypothetical protein